MNLSFENAEYVVIKTNIMLTCHIFNEHFNPQKSVPIYFILLTIKIKHAFWKVKQSRPLDGFHYITMNYHPLAMQHRAIYQPGKLTATSQNMIGAVLKMVKHCCWCSSNFSWSPFPHHVPVWSPSQQHQQPLRFLLWLNLSEQLHLIIKQVVTAWLIP